jgi:hypothetical protein
MAFTMLELPKLFLRTSSLPLALWLEWWLDAVLSKLSCWNILDPLHCD